MHKYKLLVVSLFLINQAIAAETEIAASLDGNINVNNLGVLDYSIPIDVPPSLNGFTPKLSLDYSGQSSDGVLGVGWSMNGLSAISRCQSSEKNISLRILALTEYLYTQQRKQGFVNSEFCLDGKKLILINPESISSGQAEFHVENDEFSKITVQLSSGATSSEKAAINKFIVTNKNGTVQEYGKILKVNTKNASGQYVDDQYLGVALSYLWGLTSQKDINGNYWNVEYLDDKKTDGLYPKSIKYTGNVNGVAPLNSIDFEYLDRN
ncbi:SpvB/TcaC N-terminal domain-containing protein [Acinetobacter guillouiae]|uniref:SpvB/TcaC N-terminal domain-containing protein n=1 Tax=Acinetobacter guillouiae TaxID=106649 RepID=UPI003AF5C5C1